MPKIKDIFNYDNVEYSPLREPARQVISAYQAANRFFDTIQEFVYIEYALPHLSKVIHKNAHEFPRRFDTFGDLLHERHLMVEYPATPELDIRGEVKEIDDIFNLIIRILNNIQDALESFHRVTDNARFRPMALKVEELMLQNSADYTKFLEIWARYDLEAGSLTSFDSWCAGYLDETEA